MTSELYHEEEASARRRKRIAEAKRQKKIQMMRRRLIKKLMFPVAMVLVVVLVIFIGKTVVSKPDKEIEKQSIENMANGKTTNTVSEIVQEQNNQNEINKQEQANQEVNIDAIYATEETDQLGGDIISEHAVLVDAKSSKVLAQKSANTRINPASMTKILTLLVAAEAAPNLNDQVTITRDITDYGYVNDCSNVGFEVGEVVSVRDLFYGTILPSGADAAVALAIYTSGSMEAFIEDMNEKLEELGLSETAHFTNCVGIYDKNHYCTLYDMAMIMRAAVENKLCREILSTKTYTTSRTTNHPEGITISNWFLRRIEDKDSGGEVLYGKTGYVAQSGSCAASYAVNAKGDGYICVTTNANSKWRCIEDHASLYQNYMAQ